MPRIHSPGLRPFAALRTISRHQESHRDVLAHFGQNANAIEDAFHGAEVGQVDQQFLAVRRVLRGAFLLVAEIQPLPRDRGAEDDGVGEQEYVVAEHPAVGDEAQRCGDLSGEQIDALLANLLQDSNNGVR